MPTFAKDDVSIEVDEDNEQNNVDHATPPCS